MLRHEVTYKHNADGGDCAFCEARVPGHGVGRIVDRATEKREYQEVGIPPHFIFDQRACRDCFWQAWACREVVRAFSHLLRTP